MDADERHDDDQALDPPDPTALPSVPAVSPDGYAMPPTPARSGYGPNPDAALGLTWQEV